MRYTEVDFVLDPPEPWRDILIAELGERGFESFEETPHGVKAYIRSDAMAPTTLADLLSMGSGAVKMSRTVREVEPRNWNAEWERSFAPVEVGRAVRVRAEFHPSVPGFTHEITITPRMAFGTGHHATTRMMLRAMLGPAEGGLALELEGRDVCDLGCGTAILAMLAERLGARRVLALDIDEQAVLNARENVAMNGCSRIIVEKGTAEDLGPLAFDLILANIERNTLQRDMARMQAALKAGGILLLSGFIRADLPSMEASVRSVGMRPLLDLHEGEWAMLACQRP